MYSYVRDAHPFHTERLIRIETRLMCFFCIHTATIIIVWPARPSQQAPRGEEGKGSPFPSSPLGACWDGLAGQSTIIIADLNPGSRPAYEVVLNPHSPVNLELIAFLFVFNECWHDGSEQRANNTKEQRFEILSP